MSQLTDKLQSIKLRADNATEGPWHQSENYKQLVSHSSGNKIAEVKSCFDGSSLEETDAAFIANARTDIPKLLAVIEKLIEQRDIYISFDSKSYELAKSRADRKNSELIAILEGENEI
jgi:hypothetical protein